MTAAGWYPLDNDPSKILYFDGEKWVGTPVPNPNALPQQPKSFNSLQNTPINYGGSEQQNKSSFPFMQVRSQEPEVKATSRKAAFLKLGPLAMLAIVFTIVGFGVLPSLLLPKGQADYETATTVIVASTPQNYEGYCSPQIKYSEDATVTYPLQTNVRSKPCEYHIGEQIDVYYVEGVPESVRPASAGRMSSLFPIIFGGIGLLLCFSLVISVIKIFRTKYE